MRRRYRIRHYRRKPITGTVIFVGIVIFVIAVIAYGALKKKKFVVRRFRTAIKADWRRFVPTPPKRYYLTKNEKEEPPPEYKRASDLVSSAFRAVDVATPPQPQHLPILETAVSDLKKADGLLSRLSTERAQKARRDIKAKIGEALFKMATVHYTIGLNHYQRAGFGPTERQSELRAAFKQLKKAAQLLKQAEPYFLNKKSLFGMQKEVNQILYDVQKRLSFK